MNNTNQTTILAGSILIGFALIAAAIFFSEAPSIGQHNIGHANNENAHDSLAMVGSPKRDEASLRRVYGNPEAETTIVEFSDYECPFCSRLHPTLKQVVDESEGKINWEYRHLPLSIHATAEPAAYAAECVADLAGNTAFWEYSDVLFGNQRGLTASFLETQAVALGVPSSDYQACISSPEIANRVQTDSQTAVAFGGNGTPFNVVEFADGTTRVASGALPYPNWAQIFNSIK